MKKGYAVLNTRYNTFISGAVENLEDAKDLAAAWNVGYVEPEHTVVTVIFDPEV